MLNCPTIDLFHNYITVNVLFIQLFIYLIIYLSMCLFMYFIQLFICLFKIATNLLIVNKKNK